MARPKKNTVDYFPHFCNHGKTIFILEQKFGNDGYAFWFKLLELLGSADSHFYDCRNNGAWEFLQAKTTMTEEQCINILNLLANLDAIDKNLWSKRIIWSENFIKGIADVYRNRRVEIPVKPSFYIQKPSSVDISTPENTQSKVKYIKVNKIKEKDLVEYHRKGVRGKPCTILKNENEIPLPEIPAEIPADTFLPPENFNSENIENLDPPQNEITLSKNNSEELPDTSKLSPGQIKVEIAKLLGRYSDEQVDIIHQALDAFKSTRKTYSMSDNLILIELKRWNKKPPEQVIAGLQTYLEKGCAQEGKDEKYAFGIIKRADMQLSTSISVNKGNGIDEDYLQNAWNEACGKVTSDNWDKPWSDDIITQTSKQMNLYSRAHYDREPPKSLKFDFINTLKIVLKQQQKRNKIIFTKGAKS